MQGLINEMSLKLDQLDSKLSSIYSALRDEIIYSGYNTRVALMQDFIGEITSLQENLVHFINNPQVFSVLFEIGSGCQSYKAV